MYVFASCCTAREAPNPVLWNQYGDGERGVRIKLPVDMFETYALASDPITGFHVQAGATWLVPRDEIHAG